MASEPTPSHAGVMGVNQMMLGHYHIPLNNYQILPNYLFSPPTAVIVVKWAKALYVGADVEGSKPR